MSASVSLPEGGHHGAWTIYTIQFYTAVIVLNVGTTPGVCVLVSNVFSDFWVSVSCKTGKQVRFSLEAFSNSICVGER